jgi:hypothetical protein
MSFMCLASPIDFILFHLLFLIKYADMLLFLSTALMNGLAGDCKQDKNYIVLEYVTGGELFDKIVSMHLF